MTVKQDWQRERCFALYGTLMSIRTQISSFASRDSILLSEAVLLNRAGMIIQRVLSTFNLPNTRTLSQEQYIQRKINRR